MHREAVVPPLTEAADASIVPHIGAIPAGLAQTKAIGMGKSADLEDEDQLVLGALETPHSAVGLVPDAQVLKFREDHLPGLENLAHVTPVHAHKCYCTVL